MASWTPNIDWHRVFPAEDYRFRMGLRVGAASDAFALSAAAKAILHERQRWLAESPDAYTVLNEDGVPLVRTFATWLAGQGLVSAALARPAEGATSRGEALTRLRIVAGAIEPDFVLLRPDGAGQFRAVGGAVCFPSSWALAEKLELTVAEIHSPVPALNSSLGAKIDGALARLPDDTVWCRENWGLAADAELNRHPDRGLARLSTGVRLEQVTLRLEHQSFLRLRTGGAIVFGIRVTLHPLIELARDGTLRPAIAHALRTMPPDIATYKGLANARAGLIQQLTAEVV